MGAAARYVTPQRSWQRSTTLRLSLASARAQASISGCAPGSGNRRYFRIVSLTTDNMRTWCDRQTSGGQVHRPCSANTTVVVTDLRGSNAFGGAWSRMGAGAGRVLAAAAAGTAAAAALARATCGMVDAVPGTPHGDPGVVQLPDRFIDASSYGGSHDICAVHKARYLVGSKHSSSDGAQCVGCHGPVAQKGEPGA